MCCVVAHNKEFILLLSLDNAHFTYNSFMRVIYVQHNGAIELAHMEMICAIVHQLTRNLSVEEVEKYGFDKYYVDHTLALWPQAASGAPWTATYFQSKGDPITDLHEDMAAEGATS